MSRWVAFLRGMNLGRRRIRNDELCSAFRDLGLEEVSAFLASGNVLFAARAASRDALVTRIENGLQRALDYSVPTFLRSADEVRAIANRSPFSADDVADRGKPQVTLFSKSPSQVRSQIEDLSTEDDLLVLDERELYWLPRAGLLDSELDVKTIEKLLGGTTTRTLRTLERLAAKL